MTLVLYDPGKSKRQKGDNGDCQVRAVHVATGMTYDRSWDALYMLQGKYRTMGFNLLLYLKKGEFGVIRKISFPAKKGYKRMTAEQFVRIYPRGTYVLNQAHHVCTVQDGKLFDRWNSTRRCVYEAYQIGR